MALNLNPKIFSKLHDTPQKSAIFIGLGTLILVIALFVFAIVPAVSSVIEQYEKNKRRTELVEAQDKKIENLNKLVQSEEAYANEIELLKENYPVFVDNEFIIRNLQSFMEEDGDLKYKSITIEEDKTEQIPSFVQSVEAAAYDKFDIKGVKMTLSYYCNVEGAIKFLEYVENYPSVLDILEASYTNEEDNTVTTGAPANMPMTCTTTLLYYSKILKPIPSIVPTVQSTQGTP